MLEASLIAVLGLVAVHLGVVLGVVGDIEEDRLVILHVAAIWLALLALAVRTVEEGLQPQREIERYRAYGMALEDVQAEFSAAGSPVERIEAMRSLERLSFVEMVNFLKANHEARFVM